MKWMGYVARMGEIRNAHGIFLGKSERRDHFEDLGVDVRLILKCILEK
jgi:hypothetical protein